MLQVFVAIDEITMVDLFGFSYHGFCLVGINSHTHLGVVIMEGLKLHVEINIAFDQKKFDQKKDIISIKEKSNDHTR